jgi:hypothetical protein
MKTNTTEITGCGEAFAAIHAIIGTDHEICLSGLTGGHCVSLQIGSKKFKAAKFSTILRQLGKYYETLQK